MPQQRGVEMTKRLALAALLLLGRSLGGSLLGPLRGARSQAHRCGVPLVSVHPFTLGLTGAGNLELATSRTPVGRTWFPAGSDIARGWGSSLAEHLGVRTSTSFRAAGSPSRLLPREPGRWGQGGNGASPASEFGGYVNFAGLS